MIVSFTTTHLGTANCKVTVSLEDNKVHINGEIYRDFNTLGNHMFVDEVVCYSSESVLERLAELPDDFGKISTDAKEALAEWVLLNDKD